MFLVRYLGVDQGRMLSSIAVLCSCFCGVHYVLVVLVLSLAMWARLLSAEWTSCICSLFVGSVNLSGKLPLRFLLILASCSKLKGGFAAVCLGSCCCCSVDLKTEVVLG
jgi:hypothetical protein